VPRAGQTPACTTRPLRLHGAGRSGRQTKGGWFMSFV